MLLRKPQGNKTNVLRVGELELNLSTRQAARGGQEISLSSKEFSLLRYMMQNAGIVLSRDKLEQHVWDYDFSGGSNVIDVYIRYLRKKIDQGHPVKYIHTVRGLAMCSRRERGEKAFHSNPAGAVPHRRHDASGGLGAGAAVLAELPGDFNQRPGHLGGAGLPGGGGGGVHPGPAGVRLGAAEPGKRRVPLCVPAGDSSMLYGRLPYGFAYTLPLSDGELRTVTAGGTDYSVLDLQFPVEGYGTLVMRGVVSLTAAERDFRATLRLALVLLPLLVGLLVLYGGKNLPAP